MWPIHFEPHVVRVEPAKFPLFEILENRQYPLTRPPLSRSSFMLQFFPGFPVLVHNENAAIVKRIFEMYASGQYSLAQLRSVIRTETGKTFAKSHVHTVLTNPFYIGNFIWGDKIYRGTHAALISADLHQRVQAVLCSHNKPKYGKQEIAFRGLLTCAHDKCTITAERKKGKYVYYRCTGYRGKCDTPRFREQEISQKLGEILKNINIPDEVLVALQESLDRDDQRTRTETASHRAGLEKRLAAVRRRMDQGYQDKLDGKIPEDFWERKMSEWRAEEQQIQMAIHGLRESTADRVLSAKRTLELANKAYSLYLTQNSAEQAKLLRMVLLNCSIDAASVYPTYRKPFDMIFQRARNKEWSGREDLNLRHPWSRNNHGFLRGLANSC
jgi:site-specific DNA recombinase